MGDIPGILACSGLSSRRIAMGLRVLLPLHPRLRPAPRLPPAPGLLPPLGDGRPRVPDGLDAAVRADVRRLRAGGGRGAGRVHGRADRGRGRGRAVAGRGAAARARLRAPGARDRARRHSPCRPHFASPIASRWRCSAALPGYPRREGWPRSLFHLAASFAVLLVPTALMGATLPLLARFAVERDEDLGARVGTLYTVNTVGAALGTLGAGFLLLPAIGLGKTMLVGVALNVLAFLLALPIARAAVGAGCPRRCPGSRSPIASVLPLMLVSSAVSFTYEVLWTRLLTFVLGGSVYAFSIMLATFLTGIALGAAVASRTGRTPSSARWGFVLAQWGTAVVLAGRVPLLGPPAAPGRAAPAAAPARCWPGAALSAATLLPGAVCIGATFPFAVRILAGHAGPGRRRHRPRVRVEHGGSGAGRGRGRDVAPARAPVRGHRAGAGGHQPAVGARRPRWWTARASWCRRQSPGSRCWCPAFLPPRTPWALLSHSSIAGAHRGHGRLLRRGQGGHRDGRRPGRRMAAHLQRPARVGDRGTRRASQPIRRGSLAVAARGRGAARGPLDDGRGPGRGQDRGERAALDRDDRRGGAGAGDRARQPGAGRAPRTRPARGSARPRPLERRPERAAAHPAPLRRDRVPAVAPVDRRSVAPLHP